MDSYRLSDDETNDLYRGLAIRAETSTDITFHIQLAPEVKPFVRMHRLEAYLEKNTISADQQQSILKAYDEIKHHTEYLKQWRERLKNQ